MERAFRRPLAVGRSGLLAWLEGVHRVGRTLDASSFALPAFQSPQFAGRYTARSTCAASPAFVDSAGLPSRWRPRSGHLTPTRNRPLPTRTCPELRRGIRPSSDAGSSRSRPSFTSKPGTTTCSRRSCTAGTSHSAASSDEGGRPVPKPPCCMSTNTCAKAPGSAASRSSADGASVASTTSGGCSRFWRRASARRTRAGGFRGAARDSTTSPRAVSGWRRG